MIKNIIKEVKKMTEELKFLIDTVKEASKLITEEFEVKAKDNNGDLVTNFDYEIEQYIMKAIKKEYPDFTIVSEEFNSNERLTYNCFTIDPIDGTINFANNIPLCGIQAACVKNGKTVAAVIYLFKLNELYYADENGAYLNGNKIKVNNLDGKNAIYVIEGPGKYDVSIYQRKISGNRRDLYCAAVDFAWTACGRISAVNSICNTFWDYVPGQYIVEQAGGVIYNDEKQHIAANNKKMLENMKIINKD